MKNIHGAPMKSKMPGHNAEWTMDLHLLLICYICKYIPIPIPEITDGTINKKRDED